MALEEYSEEIRRYLLVEAMVIQFLQCTITSTDIDISEVSSNRVERIFKEFKKKGILGKKGVLTSDEIDVIDSILMVQQIFFD